jgi:histidyl-tRNA synthetase
LYRIIISHNYSKQNYYVDNSGIMYKSSTFRYNPAMNPSQDALENPQKDASLSTEPYKGVRDFYPEDMMAENYIFGIMRKTVEGFGYQEYSASILEPTELYKAKSGEEIINEQTYSFKDRGDREVTLRPEMTPTVTRMVAARRRELVFPLRWYSIPNLFRYEKPQRGRLREHFQLNVDLFGIETIDAEVEMVSIAHEIMKNFGAPESSHVIRISNRKILNYLFEEIFALKPDAAYKAMKLIDKKDKLSPIEFKDQAKAIFEEKADLLISFLSTKDIREFSALAADKVSSEVLGVKETAALMHRLELLGIKNCVFDPTLARGFDYYTGTVFEVYDESPANPRALFGGGRFDDLLSVFGSDKVPAVGFGAGDVSIKDFLETYGLLPGYTSKTHVMICTIGQNTASFSDIFAQNLRKEGLNVAVDPSGKKIGQQIENASRRSIPYIIVLGEDEARTHEFKVRELATGTEEAFASEADIAKFIKHKLGAS